MSPAPPRPPLLPGTTVRDVAGVVLGRVMHLFHDPVTADPEWASLAPASGGRWLLVPLAGSTMTPDGVLVAHPGPAVLTGPTAPSGDILGYNDQLAATAYYYGPSPTPGLPPAPPTATDGATAPAVVHDGPNEVVITRSEEQLRTRTETVVAQRLRVRKVVVTEERTLTVQVRHEEYRVDNAPVGDPAPVAGGLDMVTTPDDGLTLTLYAERPVVITEVVPVERIHIVKDVVTEDRTVAATLRREVVEYPDTPHRTGQS